MKINGNCGFCGSKNIKQSTTYPDHYYCNNCSNGDLLTSLNTKNKFDKINNYFKNNKNINFQYLNPTIVKLAIHFGINEIHTKDDLSLCFALARPAMVQMCFFPKIDTNCPPKFLNFVKDTKGWLIWRNDLQNIINYYFGKNNNSILKNIVGGQYSSPITNIFSNDEIQWLFIYGKYSIPKELCNQYAEITLQEFEQINETFE